MFYLCELFMDQDELQEIELSYSKVNIVIKVASSDYTDTHKSKKLGQRLPFKQKVTVGFSSNKPSSTDYQQYFIPY